MAYRRRQGLGRDSTTTFKDKDEIGSPNPSPVPGQLRVRPDESSSSSSASSLAAKAIRASSAYRDSSLSSAYGHSSLSSPSNKLRSSSPSKVTPHLCLLQLLFTSFNNFEMILKWRNSDLLVIIEYSYTWQLFPFCILQGLIITFGTYGHNGNPWFYMNWTFPIAGRRCKL